jgi:hypothetical protein
LEIFHRLKDTLKHKHFVLQAESAAIFSQEIPNLLYPLEWDILSHWVTKKHITGR